MDDLERLRRSGYQIFYIYEPDIVSACKKIDKRLLDDEKFVLHQIKKYDERAIYRHISLRLKQKKSVGLAMMDKNPKNFDILHYNFRNNKEIAKRAIEDRAFNYYYIGGKLDNDKDLALIALEIHGLCVLDNLKKNNLLKKDKDFINKFICKYTLRYADETLKKDKNFVISLIKEHPDRISKILPYVSDELKQDEDIALAAVTYSYEGLNYVDNKFRSNDKIVLAALARNGENINLLSPEYRNREEFILVALRTYPKLYEMVNDNIKESPRVIQYMINNYPKFCESLSIFQYHYTKSQNEQLKNELNEIKSELAFIKDYLLTQDKDFSLERKDK